MFSLRVTRGSRPSIVLRRLLLAGVSSGTSFLLLCSLGFALAHPGRGSEAGIRLLWSLVPATAAVYLSVAISRVAPSPGLTSGLAVTGYGTTQLPMLAATSTGLSCTAGSTIGLAVFLRLRGDLLGPPLTGDLANALGVEQPLPTGATLTLLALVPLVGAAASALVLRPRQIRPPKQRARDHQERQRRPRSPRTVPAVPPGLPWGAVLCCAGLVLELYAGQWQPSLPGDTIALPSGLGRVSSLMLLGWIVTAAGFVAAGPGLVHLSGHLLAARRPHALRLIAGRGLQSVAARIGRPLSVLCIAGSAGLATARLWNVSVSPRLGPLSVLGASLVLVCVLGALLTAAAEARGARRATIEALTRLGASAGLLRRATILRLLALLLVFVPVTWLVGELAALPLYR